MVMETYEKLEHIKKELEFLCDKLFKTPPKIRIEDGEDAPCVCLDDDIMICYCYTEGYYDRVYEIQKTVIEHNYPHEPDWMDFVTLAIRTTVHDAIIEAIQAWVNESISIMQENAYYEQMAKENSESWPEE